MTKICSNCNVELPSTREYFYSNLTSVDLLRGECKKCCSAKQRIWQKSFNYNQSQIDGRLDRKGRGLCGYCVKSRLEHSNNFCEDHYFGCMAKARLGQYKKWRELKNKFYAQDGRCAYTGEKLILGLSDSCDHIKPTSKYPKLRGDINNIQFITRDVNAMKRDFEHDVFIQMMKNILNYVETGVGVAPIELVGKSKNSPVKNNQLPLFPNKTDKRSKAYKKTIRHSSF